MDERVDRRSRSRHRLPDAAWDREPHHRHTDHPLEDRLAAAALVVILLIVVGAVGAVAYVMITQGSW